MEEGGGSSCGCETAGPSQSDLDMVVDAVKPQKNPRRKTAPRKKKAAPACHNQCHGEGAPLSTVPADMDVVDVHSSVTNGFAPLLSALCDHGDITCCGASSGGNSEAVNVDSGITPEVIDSSQSVERPDAEFPNSSTNKAPPVEKKKRDSKKKWSGSIKRGCLGQFTVKTLLYASHVTKLCIIQEKHVNRDGLVVHGGMKSGDRSAFSAHLSPKIRTFVEECLRRKDSSNQIMKKHLDLLKQYQAAGRDITRDLLLTTKDIRNIFGKLAQETYMLHKNDAQSVRMWVERNPEKVFYYTESNKAKPVPVPGELTGANMPFTIGIQTDWQRKMMLKHGHRAGISIDATFGTNEKNVSLQNNCMHTIIR